MRRTSYRMRRIADAIDDLHDQIGVQSEIIAEHLLAAMQALKALLTENGIDWDLITNSESMQEDLMEVALGLDMRGGSRQDLQVFVNHFTQALAAHDTVDELHYKVIELEDREDFARERDEVSDYEREYFGR